MSSITGNGNLRVGVSNRQILKMALPISFGILVPQLNFITNNIFLGHLHNTGPESANALSTAGITGVYYLIFAAIGYGLNNGLQALISRRAGENRTGEIGRLFTQGIGISMGIAALGILITYLVAPTLMEMSIKDPAIRDQAIEYLKIRIWGLPFLYIYQMRNALLVGTNQSKYLVAGTIAEALSNVFFDYVFIFGKWGFPNLGFNGAAVASIIAEFLGMAVVFWVIHLKGIGKRFALFSNLTFDAKNTRLILQQSSPLIFQHAISIISWEFFYILIERNQQSRHDLAISNTMRNIFGLFGMFSWAFAATCNSMVSNIIGQGLQERVPELIRKIVRLSTGSAIFICIILNIFPELFLSIYGQGDEFIQTALPVVRVVSLALVLMSFGTVWLNAVTGTGNSRVNLLIEFITIIIYSAYVYVVFEWLHLPIVIGWMSEWLYWSFMFAMSYFYIRSGKWKGKVI
ncbi:MAG: MATE family efflux transporter [Gemmatimonadaceae bacterium]|nr:MATE family efflux transporter [Chitinophagaceae bacterium]